jgi:FeS assembly SUF system protein
MGLFSRWRKSDETEERGDAPAPSMSSSARPSQTAPPAAATTAPELPPPSAVDTGFDTSALTAPATPVSNGQPTVGQADPTATAALQGKIIDALKTVYDPEIPVDIYELGLIYDIAVDAEKRALIKMTLTSPACPSAQQIPSEVRYKVKALPEIEDAAVEIVWEPPWDKDRMSEAAKLQLGFY